MPTYNYPADFEGTQWQVVNGDYYVSLNGSDTGVGSPQDPFLTLKKALEVAAPGERIIVNPDEYAAYGMANEAAGTLAPCRLASTVNIDLLTVGSVVSVDGIDSAAWDRVLLINQSDQTENGVYEIALDKWRRAGDFNETDSLRGGSLVAILEGATQAGKIFQNINTGTLEIGVSEILFQEAYVRLSDFNAGLASKVAKVGIPANDQLGVWTEDGSIEGTPALTFDGSDLKLLESVNNGNPQIQLGSSSAEQLTIQSVYDTGAQTLDHVLLQTKAASASTDKGKFTFAVDETNILDIRDGGIYLLLNGSAGTPAIRFNDTNTGIYLGGADILSFSAGGTERARVDSGGIDIKSGGLDIAATQVLTSGRVIQNITQLTVDNIRIDGNTISSIDTNGDILLSPNGTGSVKTSAGHTSTIAEADDVITKGYADTNYGGTGNVTKSGTPEDNQIAVWTGNGTIEGTNDLYFSASGGTGSLFSQLDVLEIASANGNTKLTLSDAGSEVVVNSSFRSEGIILGQDDLQLYKAINNGNPQIRIGATDAEEFHIQTVYNTGAQTLDYVLFQTDVASATADKGKFTFAVDEINILDIRDGGIYLLLNGSAGTPAIRFNDTNTGIYLGGADILSFSAGGTERARVDSGGIDIISGGLNVAATQVLTSGRVIQNITQLTVDNISVDSNTVSTVIGALSLFGTSGMNIWVGSGGIQIETAGDNIDFINNSLEIVRINDIGLMLLEGGVLNASGGVILTEGGVPSSGFGPPDSVAPSSTDKVFLWDTSASNAPKYATVQDILNLGGGGGNVTKVGTPANNQIAVWTGDGTIEGDSSLTWDGASQVLSVSGNIGIQGYLQSQGDIESTAGNFLLGDGQEIRLGDSTDVSIDYDPSGDDLVVSVLSTNSDILFKTGATTRFTFDMGTYKGTATDWIATSDERLKDSFGSFGSVLSRIQSLKGKFSKFKWKESGAEDVGYGAQTMQSVFPELVNTNNKDVLGLSYGKLSGIALEGVAEVNEEVMNLRREVAELKRLLTESRGQADSYVY